MTYGFTASFLAGALAYGGALVAAHILSAGGAWREASR